MKRIIKMNSNLIREASHAGTWYSGNSAKLNSELDSWLSAAKMEISDITKVKALIGPHAGFAYSGPTAAWAYKYLKPSENLKVFLLGPCHYVSIEGCALSSLNSYQTPVGNIEVDQNIIAELKAKGKFHSSDKEMEEEEHSLEMHLPYIAKTLTGHNFTIVPIMVGHLNPNLTNFYGNILSEYYDRDDVIFAISSDFCHWGKRFQYTRYKPEDGDIHQSIEKLDHEGMQIIESKNLKGFEDYLSLTKNTICGRNPISILLSVMNQSKIGSQTKVKFVQYAQSEPVKTQNQSSVSYASAIIYT